ncbi:MAG: hypothetical protein KIS91_17790 [Anaerolineae bacterium]|nr:hypothetical protein [Anaerolineae bacterium]
MKVDSTMESLLIKLVVTPMLVGAASLAGRRWGPGVSGWLVALPLTSGPIVFFLALSHGAHFASSVAAATLVGAISQAAFCLAYSHTALRWRWPHALLFACLGFLVATLVLQSADLPLLARFLLVVLGLLVALRLMPPAAAQTRKERVAPPRWDIPARMVVTTTFVVLLTASASALGASLTGLLAPFPLFATVLAVFAHRHQGPEPAVEVLRGLLYGLFSFAGFFLVLGMLLDDAHIAGAFGAAIAVALVIQGVTLWAQGGRTRLKRALPPLGPPANG